MSICQRVVNVKYLNISNSHKPMKPRYYTMLIGNPDKFAFLFEPVPEWCFVNDTPSKSAGWLLPVWSRRCLSFAEGTSFLINREDFLIFQRD